MDDNELGRCRLILPQEIIAGTKVAYMGGNGKVIHAGSADQEHSDSAVGEEDARMEDDPNQFVQQVIVPWLKLLSSKCDDLKPSLAHALHGECPEFVGSSSTEGMAEAMRKHIPWGQGYVNMQQVPKSSKKGHIHVSMLACTADAYPANGLFLADAIVLLEAQGWAGLESKAIEVRPRPGQKPTCFGWEADGAVINGTYAFIMSSIAVWSTIFATPLP